MQRKNSKVKFIETTVRRIGYPRWDKSRTVKGHNSSNFNGGGNDSIDITYIPFVRDSQSFVNAAWIVKTTPRDTAFGYLCDWQYKDYGFDTASSGWNARNIFHLFSQMDKDVFNRQQFRITDERLLTQREKNYLDSTNTDFDSALVVYRLSPSQSYNTANLWLPVEFCDDIGVCIRIGGLLAFRGTNANILQVSGGCPPGYEPMIATICTQTMVFIPGGDGGGSDSPPGDGGGTGGGGSGPGPGSTPPLCSSGVSGKNNLVEPCSPGWEPIEDLPIDDPYDPNNNLPLPCESPVDHSLFDDIWTNNERVKEAFKYILPPEYSPFIQFDQNGILNKPMLLSAQNSSGIPDSDIYDALVACINSGFNINIYLTSAWQGVLLPSTTLQYYSWEAFEQSIYGISVMPGEIPTVTGVPVTGNPSTSWIFIRKGEESSNKRLAYLIVHELLGHMYSFIRNNPSLDGDPQFEIWRNKIEAEAQKNWKMIKKWKDSNQSCF